MSLLAQRAIEKIKRDTRAWPFLGDFLLDALVVKHVATPQQQARRRRQGIRVANAAEFRPVNVGNFRGALVVEARQATCLALHATTRVIARQQLAARLGFFLLAFGAKGRVGRLCPPDKERRRRSTGAGLGLVPETAATVAATVAAVATAGGGVLANGGEVPSVDPRRVAGMGVAAAGTLM